VTTIKHNEFSWVWLRASSGFSWGSFYSIFHSNRKMLAYHYEHTVPARHVPSLGHCAVCGLLLTTAATWPESLERQVSEMDVGERIENHRTQWNE
jgi:hypothetical protein